MEENSKLNLEEAILYALKYGAITYPQLETLNKVDDGTFTIKYPYSELPENGLVFFIPNHTSVKGNNYLALRAPRMVDGKIKYDIVKKYFILIEDIDGSHKPIGENAIVPNRLCIFRFMTNIDNQVILVNNPEHNNISCSTLTVYGEAKFKSLPAYVDETNTEYPLVTKVTTDALEKRLTKLENMISFGTADAEEILNTADSGTIYIKVEEV